MGFTTRHLTRRALPVVRRFAGTASLLMIIDEIWIVFRQRSGTGTREIIDFPLRFLKYFVCTIIVFARFGRGAFVALSLFTWFRRVDDVVDGDTPLPQGWSAQEYRSQKSRLFRAIKDGTDADLLIEDIALVRGVESARHHGMAVIGEIVDIWEVMEWGCLRQEGGHLASRPELLVQTAKQDRAVLRICVKALGGNVDRFDEIAKGFTGSFIRADWLDDMLEDLQRGVINIPTEAVSEYKVDMARILECKTWDELTREVHFARWYRDEVRQSRIEWREMRSGLGNDFAGVFRSKIVSWAFMRMMVAKTELQFERAASHAT